MLQLSATILSCKTIFFEWVKKKQLKGNRKCTHNTRSRKAKSKKLCQVWNKRDFLIGKRYFGISWRIKILRIITSCISYEKQFKDMHSIYDLHTEYKVSHLKLHSFNFFALFFLLTLYTIFFCDCFRSTINRISRHLLHFHIFELLSN
jgi:hypothetical protein